MKPPERDSSSLSGEDNTCPSSPLGKGSCQAAVPVAKPWAVSALPVVTAGVGNSQLEQGECLEASAIVISSWPGSGKVSIAMLSSTPKSPQRSRPPLGWAGWDVFSVVSCPVEVHHHKVPSIFISPFCHRKAKDFIILTVLHTHQVRLAGPAPGEPQQG